MRLSRALVVLGLATGCKRRDAAPPSREAPASAVTLQGAPDPVDAGVAGAYRVVVVRDGGTVTGHVRWQGPRPASQSMEVPPHGNPAGCGATQPLAPLVIGDDGGVSSAVISLADITQGVAPAAETVTIDQRGCRYEPRVSSATVGATLRFTNSDVGVFHNVHAYFGERGDDGWFNAATPAGVDFTHRVERVGVARFLCDSGHAWMLAWLHAFNHPYHAVSDARGAYTLRDVPAGIYRVHLWHEGWVRHDVTGDPRPTFPEHVELERPATVIAGAVSTVDFTLAAPQ